MKFSRNILSLLTFIIIGILSANSLCAQSSFTISEFDASQFPTVKAGFIALDATGQSYKNLEIDDFELRENGVLLNHAAKVECNDTLIDPHVSIALVLDQSTSMTKDLDGKGDTRWKWVKEGVESFLAALKFTSETRVSLHTFGGMCFLHCPFTDSPQRILDSLEEIEVYGVTNYDPAFLDIKQGPIEYLKTRPPSIRRIIVFLTDGLPDDEPSRDSIIKKCHEANIQVYAITLAMPMHWGLDNISNETGGKSFEVFTKSDLNKIYELIALDIQSKQFCSIIWDSPFGCDDDDRYRDVSIKFLEQGKTVSRPYVAPESSIADVELSDNIVSFGDPEVDQSEIRSVTISPKNTSLDIDTLIIQPSTFFEVLPEYLENFPMTIDSGKSETFEIKFTQDTYKQFRQATFTAVADPCPQNITLVGGYSNVIIVYPTGGEVFSTCDSIDIQWAGVSKDKPINLYYSADDGATWELILPTNLTGLHHTWLPPKPGEKYLISAAVSPDSYYLWAKSEGGEENVVGTSIAIQKDALYYYVTGYFEGEATFGDQTITSKGLQDIFVAKYDSDGNMVWVNTAGGPGVDTSAAIALDDDNNAFITGSCHANAIFGNIHPTMEYEGKAYYYIARFPANGQAPSVDVIGPDSYFQRFEAGGRQIRYDDSKIFVRGFYKGEIIKNGQSLADTEASFFTAEYKLPLKLSKLVPDGPIYSDYSSDEAYDKHGNKYTVGSFEGTATYGIYTLTSQGAKDMFISKFGGVPGSSDTCEVFSVESPELLFSEEELDLGECTIKQTVPGIFTEILCNYGSLPVVIDSVAILGANANDFSLVSNLSTLTVPPDSCITVEINFKAGEIGPREAMMTIFPDCGDPADAVLKGTGKCGGVAEPLVDLGVQNINVPKTQDVNCAFLNTNNSTLKIEPEIEGDNPGDFKLYYKGSLVKPGASYLIPADGCFEVTVEFTPQAPGKRVAYINYHTPEGCDNPLTELNGYGSDNDLLAEPVDWGGRRLLSSNDEKMKVTNNGSLDINIENIKLRHNNSVFSLQNLPSFPMPMTAGGETEIDLRFIPVLEQLYRDTVEIYIVGGSAPVLAPIAGQGIIPKINPVFVCSAPTSPGTTVAAELQINNPSPDAELFVEEVKFINHNGEYVWASDTTNITIAPNGTEKLDVLFTPNLTGKRPQDIEILSDACDASEEDLRVETTITAECEGIGLKADPHNFGNVLVCDEYTSQLEISNTSTETAMTINEGSVSGADKDYFELSLPNNVTVQPESSSTIDVIFKPEEERTYNATLLVHTIEGASLEVELTGYGQMIHLYIGNKNQMALPGGEVKLYVKAKIAELSTQYVDNLGVKIKLSDDMLYYREGSFSPGAITPNWTWDTSELNNLGGNQYDIIGTGLLETPFDANLFAVTFDVYLSSVKKTDIILQPLLEPCVTADTIGGWVNLQDICFTDGRLIEISKERYSLSEPNPNPANDKIDLTFSVALDGQTKLEIVNSMGETVYTVVDASIKSGVYQAVVPTMDLSSGVYIVRLISGPFVRTQKLMISK